MGQYYYPVNIDKKPHEYLYSHDGLKLMEHSYIYDNGNNFVGAVLNLLTPDGAWYKSRIVWAGDYADSEDGTIDAEHKDGVNLHSQADIDGLRIKPDATDFNYQAYPFLVNWTKKCAVAFPERNEQVLTVNPLPLLTCEGNGRGGGDYQKEDSRVGSWARDVISVEEKVPDGFAVENGVFTE